VIARGASRLVPLLGFALLASVALAPIASKHALADDSWSRALTRRDLPAITQLANAGADVNRPNGDGMTALMVACAQGDSSLMRLLLDRGAKIDATNDRGGTALMYSATAGDLEAVGYLLGRGARVNSRATNGWSALTLAAARGFEKVAEMLLAHGADPNVADIYGWTPLMRAVEHDRRDVVRVLLASPRLKIDSQNENGHSALHVAALEGADTIARLLMASGANPALKDRADRTPAELGMAAGHPETARIVGGSAKN